MTLGLMVSSQSAEQLNNFKRENLQEAFTHQNSGRTCICKLHLYGICAEIQKIHTRKDTGILLYLRNQYEREYTSYMAWSNFCLMII